MPYFIDAVVALCKPPAAISLASQSGFAEESLAMLARSLLSLILVASAAALPLPSVDALSPPPAGHHPADRLEVEMRRIALASDGVVGVGVRSLDNGRTIFLNGDVRFPMASTFKVAIAGAILAQVDAGTAALDEPVPIDPATAAPTQEGALADSTLAAAPTPAPIIAVGRTAPLKQLLEQMLILSDNAATDALLARAGGPAAVNAWLARQDVTGLTVDDSVANMLYRAMGISPGPGTMRENIRAALKADPVLAERDRKDIPNIAFSRDPRDTTTPGAMLDLLGRIESGRALSPASTQLMLGIMARCRTGEGRLKARLPLGARIAHKTGSLNGIGNDVGIITLPDGHRFAIAVFVMRDSRGRASRDRMMADIARVAYDYMLLVEA